MSSDKTVWTFFYGSYMNFDVLEEVNLVPQAWTKAWLPGQQLRIEPRANLLPSQNDTAYGIMAATTHAELERLYAHARDVLGETYLPEAVLVQTFDGLYRPVLCYISADMAPAPASSDYVDRILKPAREYGFPDRYLRHIESFKPGGAGLAGS